RARDRIVDLRAIEEVDPLPPRARHIARLTAARTVPRDDVAAGGCQQVEQVTARESRRAGDEQLAHVFACSAFSAASAPSVSEAPRRARRSSARSCRAPRA